MWRFQDGLMNNEEKKPKNHGLIWLFDVVLGYGLNIMFWLGYKL